MSSSEQARSDSTVGGPTLITKAAAAGRLGVSPSTVTRLIASGDLPAVQLGPRTQRVDVARLTEFIESRTTTGRAG